MGKDLEKFLTDLQAWEDRLHHFYAAGFLDVPLYASTITRILLAKFEIMQALYDAQLSFNFRSLAGSIVDFASELAVERRRQTKYDRAIMDAAAAYFMQPKGPIWLRIWRWFAGNKLPVEISIEKDNPSLSGQDSGQKER